MLAAALALTSAACNSGATSGRTDSTTVTSNDRAAAHMGDSDSALSWALLPFTKVDSVNPVLTPGKARFTDPILQKEIAWEEKDVFNPATVVKDGKIYLLYRAQGKIGHPAGTSRIGLASSTDGLHFKIGRAHV